MAPPSAHGEGGMLSKPPAMAGRREHSYASSSTRHAPKVVVDAEEHGDNVPHRRQISHGDEEGVEVVLSARGSSRVVDSSTKSRHAPDQNVFRPPPPHAVRPRAVRPQSGGPQAQPYMHASGSFGAYGPPPPPPPRGDYPPPPYPVPYNPSGSFDDGSYHHQQSHYSPHIQYPPPNSATMYPNEDVNVISPNHKGDPQYRPPTTPRQRYAPPPPHYYHYPPASPVSRPSAAHSNSPPRGRGGHYGGRRHHAHHGPPPGHDGPYAAAQRGGEMYHPDDGTWNAFPSSGSQPPLVTESSFDSEQHFGPNGPPPGGPPQSMGPPPPAHHHPPYDPHQQFYGGGGSWGSFDSAPVPPPPHFDDYRYYGYPSPYPPYPQYAPSGGYYGDPYQNHYDRPPYEDDEHLLKDYHPDRDGEDLPNAVTPGDKSGGDTPIASNTSSSGMALPKAAYEVDFDVFDPPLEPILPPSNDPICDSPAEVNSYDVLCGRGGGTNSQIGNRRFRKLVQDFQPTYLLARRKEKPLLARTIVLIIRKRGGRFLKKDEETGELFEVGDAKAEAKTSQALREGLDVRATKTAATSLMDKKKKKKGGKLSKESTEGADDEDSSSKKSPPPEDPTKEEDDEEEEEEAVVVKPPESPPTLPRLQGDEGSKSGLVHPHSPETIQFRKRRRMRSGGCDPFNDRLFPEFCPPRADLARTSSPTPEDGTSMDLSNTPLRRNTSHDDSIHVDNESVPAPGCAGIALDLMGVATGSFCLGPTRWRSG